MCTCVHVYMYYIYIYIYKAVAKGAVPGQVHFFPCICDAPQIKASPGGFLGRGGGNK